MKWLYVANMICTILCIIFSVKGFSDKRYLFGLWYFVIGILNAYCCVNVFCKSEVAENE